MTQEVKIKEPVANDPQIEELFNVGAHIAYSRSKRHPSVKKFLFGKKQKNDIIDLSKTAQSLKEAENFIKDLAEQGKTILFVGTKPEAKNIIEKYAKEANMPYISFRWIGGLITNFPEIKKRIDRLSELAKLKDSEEFSKYTKKEQGVISKELETLLKKFEGVKNLTGLPHAIFVIDSLHESLAVEEANKMGIPVVGLCGSDCDITKVTYPIVANDASVKSIEYFVSKIASNIKK